MSVTPAVFGKTSLNLCCPYCCMSLRVFPNGCERVLQRRTIPTLTNRWREPMTQEPTVTPGAPAGRPTLKQDIAAGTSIGAGILLVTVGILQLLQGISAVVNDELFVSGVQYIYKFDFTGWGWIHILL